MKIAFLCLQLLPVPRQETWVQTIVCLKKAKNRQLTEAAYPQRGQDIYQKLLFPLFSVQDIHLKHRLGQLRLTHLMLCICRSYDVGPESSRLQKEG